MGLYFSTTFQKALLLEAGLLEISHKNDVYSAGLCILETMTRGVINLEVNKSEDGKGKSKQFWKEFFMRRPFNYVQFCQGIQRGKITEFHVPSCSLDRFHKTIKMRFLIGEAGCLLFERDLRPTAAEAIEGIEPDLFEVVDFLRANGTYRDGIEPRPIIDETQQILVKPLGINGTTNRIPVYDHANQWPTSDSSTVSFCGLSSGDEPEVVESDLRLLRKFFRGSHSKIAEPKKKFVGRLHPYNSTPRWQTFDAPRKKYVHRVMKNYAKLSIQEKEDFLTKIPILLDERKQQKLVYLEPDAAEEREKLELFFQSSDIYENFSAVLLFDYLRFCEAIHAWSIKKLGYKEDTVFPWSQNKLTDHFQSYFGYLKSHTYSPRLFLKDYFSMNTKKHWYLLSVNEHEFISSDLTQVKHFEGNFLDDQQQIFLVKKNANEMRFVRDRAFDPYQFVQRADIEAAVNNEMARFEIERFVSLDMQSVRAKELKIAFTDELPIPGYIFESRSPPRRICRHEPKCELKRFPHADFFTKQYESVENIGLQFPYYSCTSEVELGYMNSWLELLEVFDEPVQSAFLSIYSASTTVFKMSTDSEFTKSEITKSFVFRKILFSEKEGKYLTLLDHPKNYREHERVIGLDLETKDVYKIGAQELAEKLEKEKSSFVGKNLL